MGNVVSERDQELIQAAKTTIAKRFKPNWHVVGSALRLRTGEVVSGVHLDANIGRIAVCAEAVALGQAVTIHGSSDIETIVAVYHSLNGQIDIVSPCGMCREMISDYAPNARVLMPDDQHGYQVCKISKLLPGKYRRSE